MLSSQHLFISLSCFLPSFLFLPSPLNLYLQPTPAYCFLKWLQRSSPVFSGSLANWRSIVRALSMISPEYWDHTNWRINLGETPAWQKEVGERQRQTKCLSLKKYDNVHRGASRRMQRRSLTKWGKYIQGIRTPSKINTYRCFAR